jgi:hypothetical protein
MTKYFVHPFASGGDKTAVPDEAQVDGSVSYSTGWGFDYERNPDPLVDPLTKDVPRDQSNQLGFDVTENIKFFQDFTAPEWSAAKVAISGYPRNARVAVAGIIYISTVADNISTPGASSTWITSGETDPTLVAIAALTPTANEFIYFTAPDVAATAAVTSFGRSWLAAPSAGDGLALLGIGTAGTGVEGLVAFANDAQVNAGTDAPIVLNPRQLRLGFSASISDNGFVLFPSWLGGFGICWGTVSVLRNSPAAVPLPFPNNNFIFAAGFAERVARSDVECSTTRVSPNLAWVHYHHDGGGSIVNCWYFGIGN